MDVDQLAVESCVRSRLFVDLAHLNHKMLCNSILQVSVVRVVFFVR